MMTEGWGEGVGGTIRTSSAMADPRALALSLGEEIEVVAEQHRIKSRRLEEAQRAFNTFHEVDQSFQRATRDLTFKGGQ